MTDGKGNYSFFNHKLRMPNDRASPTQRTKLLDRRESSENTLHQLESLSILSPSSTVDVNPLGTDVALAGFVPHPPSTPRSSDDESNRKTSARFRGKKRTRNESPRNSGSDDEIFHRKFAFTSKVSPLTSPRRVSTGSLESLGSPNEVELLRRRNIRGLEPLKGIGTDKELINSFKSYQHNAKSGSPNDNVIKSKGKSACSPVIVVEKSNVGKIKGIKEMEKENKVNAEPTNETEYANKVTDNVDPGNVRNNETSSLSSDEESFTNVSGNDDDDDDDDDFDDDSFVSTSSSDEELKQISENIAKELTTKRYPNATLPSLPRNKTMDSGKYENIGSGTYEKCSSAMNQNANPGVYENTKPDSNSRQYQNLNGTVSSVGESTLGMYETISGFQNRTPQQAQSNSTGDLNKLEKKSSRRLASDSKVYNSDTDLSMAVGSEFSNASRASLLPRVPARKVKMRGQGFLKEEMERYFPDHKVGVFVATWNMHEEKDVPGYLDDFLLPECVDFLQDIYVIGLQESTSSRSEWEIRLQETLGPSHVLMYCCSFGVLHLAVFVRRELVWFCSAVNQETIATRPGHMIKTKGGLAVSFSLFGTSFLFINSHLTSDEGKSKDRVNDYNKIRKSLSLQAEEKPWTDNSSDVTDRFDRVFWLGDFNFRVDMERKKVVKLLEAYQKQENPDYKELLQKDQLSCLMSKDEVFLGFSEPPITFPPTYKLDIQSDEYDSSSKMRTPSWTDRVLYKSRADQMITPSCYGACTSVKTSDHRPVYGIYEVKLQPCKESVNLTGGQFVRDVYIEAYRRRATAVNKTQQDSSVCTIL